MPKACRDAPSSANANDAAQSQRESLVGIVTKVGNAWQECGHEARQVVNCCEQLKKQITSCDTTNSPAWLRRVQGRLHDLSTEVRGGFAEDLAAAEESARKDESIHELQEQLTRLRRESRGAERRSRMSVGQKEARIKSLESQNNALRAQLDDLDSNGNAAQRLQWRIAELEAQLQAPWPLDAAVIAGKDDTIRTLKAKLRENEQRTNDLVEKYEQKVSDLVQSEAELEGEITVLVRSQEDAKHQIEIQEQELARNQGTISSLEGEINDLQSAQTTLQRDMDHQNDLINEHIPWLLPWPPRKSHFDDLYQRYDDFQTGEDRIKAALRDHSRGTALHAELKYSLRQMNNIKHQCFLLLLGRETITAAISQAIGNVEDEILWENPSFASLAELIPRWEQWQLSAEQLLRFTDQAVASAPCTWLFNGLH